MSIHAISHICQFFFSLYQSRKKLILNYETHIFLNVCVQHRDTLQTEVVVLSSLSYIQQHYTAKKKCIQQHYTATSS